MILTEDHYHLSSWRFPMSDFIHFLNENGWDMKKELPKNLEDWQQDRWREIDHNMAPQTKVKSYPQFVTDFLDSIKNLSPTEKIHLINHFVNTSIQFKDQESCTPEDTKPAANIFHEGEGDCDDFAFAKAELLHKAGLEDVYTVAATVKYHFKEGSSGAERHSITVTRNPDDGQFYILDNLTEEPYKIAKDGFASDADNLKLPDNQADGDASMEVIDVTAVAKFSNKGGELKSDIYIQVPLTQKAPASQPEQQISPEIPPAQKHVSPSL